jgi:hypothetical protein
MKTSAMVIGILGGIVGLAVGLIGYYIGSVAAAADPTIGTLIKVISIVIPVVGLIGAGMVKRQPLIGAVLMFASALAFVLIFRVGGLGYAAVALLAVAGVLGLLGMRRPAVA